MLRLVGCALMSLVVAAVFARPAVAQGVTVQGMDAILEALHVGEVAYDIDATGGIVRGTSRRHAGRPNLPQLEFVCDGRSFLLRDLTAQTQDLYPAEPGFCAALASALRQRSGAR
jgi:hypothetical protein